MGGRLVLCPRDRTPPSPRSNFKTLGGALSHHKLNVTVVTLCRLLRGENCKPLLGDFLVIHSPLFKQSVETQHYLVALFSNYLRTGRGSPSPT